jgi:hypothetical protein
MTLFILPFKLVAQAKTNKCTPYQFSLEAKTMFDVRNWERFQFLLDCEHQTVGIALHALYKAKQNNMYLHWVQSKIILQRELPPDLKLSIAKTIENNLFSKVI